MARIATLTLNWLVLSGSLPPGVPDNFYSRVVEIARHREIAVVLDTSGTALKATLAHGGVPGTDLCHRTDVERLAATVGVGGMGDGGPIT